MQGLIRSSHSTNSNADTDVCTCVKENGICGHQEPRPCITAFRFHTFELLNNRSASQHTKAGGHPTLPEGAFLFNQ
ncbi:hypothetical protein EV2_036358 [Malus domestica]